MVSHRDLALLTARSRPFSDSGWLFELKLDGYRALAVRGDGVRVVSRQGRDLSVGFPEVVDALLELPKGTALDGELVILDAEGRPQFERLARAWAATERAARMAAQRSPATFMAFDILWDAGEDVRGETIEARKERLSRRVTPTPHLRPVLPFWEQGEWLYAQAEALRLEGIVAKRRGSLYRAGMTRDWLKIKTPHGKEVEAKRFEHLRA